MSGFDCDGYWYVATPYSKYPAGLDAAYRDANRAAAGLVVQHGMRVFCPIAHSHSLCSAYGTEGGIDDAVSHDFWKWFDQPMVDACHGVAVVMMDGWDDSRGLLHEVAEARKAGKPVLYFTWPALVLWEAEIATA
jgi:hypothetical protein